MFRININIPAEALDLINILNDNFFEAFVVGGCVRDSLIGKTPHDWDICTSATPEEVCGLMDAYRVRTIKTGLQHGTITACCENGNYEITTFRMDGKYSDNRRPDSVEFVNNVVDDLARRDFTINAMACYPNGKLFGELVDPWSGYSDLMSGIIRCVGNPDDRFKEDALRIMRALRFASTYGFKIEDGTSAAIHRNKDLLRNISAERIRDELCKMLCGNGVLDVLLEYSDVMTVIIPELEPCVGFDQNNRFHLYTVYDHIAHAVDNYKGFNVSIKMALLLHDIGKPSCYTEDMNGGHFHGHGVVSYNMSKDIMERLKFDNKTKDEVVELVLYHDSDIPPYPKTIKRWLNKIGEEQLLNLLRVKLADIRAHSEIGQIPRIDACCAAFEMLDTVIENQQCFKIGDLHIDGFDIIALGVDQGPIVGEILTHLLDMVIDGAIENDHTALRREAERYLRENHYGYFQS